MINELIQIWYLKLCLADDKVSVSVNHGHCSELADSLFNPGMPDEMTDLYMISVLRGNAEPTWDHTHSCQSLAF